MGSELALFIAIGFFAQAVDGALGMAFGVIAATSLMASGLPPPLASAAVHAAEVATTGLSAASHIWNRNVDWRLFRRLALFGVIGGALGAYAVTGLPEDVVLPLVTVYLGAMAALVLARALAGLKSRWRVPIPPLGLGGGFLDAVGGGGWGPIVTATLLASGDQPRRIVGTANAAEFVIATAVSVTFLARLDLSDYGTVVLGLVIGGAIAAPLAGLLTRLLPARTMLIMVGTVVSALTAFNLYQLVAGTA